MPTDRSGFRYETRDLSRKEKLKLNTILLDLRKSYISEHELVMLIQDCIYSRISPSALAEYYKGAHVVFADNGDIYQELRTLSEQSDMTYWYRYAKDSTLETAKRLQPCQLSNLYTVACGYDTADEAEFPQIGVDLSIGGHLLFGIVPDAAGKRSQGNTFVQTVGIGFSNVSTINFNGWGFLLGAQHEGNTGLLGYSPHSERYRREIRELEREAIPYEQLIFEARIAPFDWSQIQRRLDRTFKQQKSVSMLVQFLLESGLEEEEFEQYVDPHCNYDVELEYLCPRSGQRRIYVRKRL